MGTGWRRARRYARWLLPGRLHNAALWEIPRSPRIYILCVDVVGAALLATTLALGSFTRTDALYFAILLLISVAYNEGGARIEKLRQFVVSADNPTTSAPFTLWAFAGSLVLPLGLAGLLAALTSSHWIYHALRDKSGARLYRAVFTGCTDVLAVLAAAAVVSLFPGVSPVSDTSPISLLVVVPAVLAFAVVDQVLIAVVLIILMRPPRMRSVFNGPDEQVLELGMMSLSVLLAVTVVHAPYLAAFTLPLIFVLRRSAVVRELQRQASTDSKTGLLNSAAWRREADKEFVGAEHLSTPISVLMVDLDHFKRLNDFYGHQAGDATLKDVGACLIDSLRSNDKVGRFGGEEFVALLPGTDEQLASVVAERLRERVSELVLAHGGTITASVGVATGRIDRHGLDELIAVADKALYVAKAAGRNQVRCQVIGGPVLEIDRTAVIEASGGQIDEAAIEAAVERLISEVNGPDRD